MRRIIYSLLTLTCIYSCNKEPQPLSPRELQQKIDSINSCIKQQSDAQAKTDLEYRIKIEVKVMADSILRMRMQKQTADTNHTAPRPQITMMPAMAPRK